MTDNIQNSKKKRTAITVAIIAASIVLIAGVVLAVVLLNNRPSSGTGIDSVFAAGDELSKKKYAAKSGLERGESKRIGEYWVKRSDDDEKFDYLRVESQNYGSSDKKDYVKIKVFNSSKDAKKYFKKTYSYYIEYDAEFDNEGSNWFIVKEPQTYDAAWKTIYYLEDNVILSAEVWSVYYGTWGEGEDQTQATLAFERSELTKYVMDNAADLRKQVLTFLSDVL